MTDKTHWIAQGPKLFYDPTPGGIRNEEEKTTSFGLRIPIATITGWVENPAKVCSEIADALNSQERLEAEVKIYRNALSEILGYDRNFYDNGRPGYEHIAKAALDGGSSL